MLLLPKFIDTLQSNFLHRSRELVFPDQYATWRTLMQTDRRAHPEIKAESSNYQWGPQRGRAALIGSVL